MHLESGQLIFSPSDLTLFMDSPFASWMEHLALTHPHLLPAPDKKDELLDVLHDMGNQHESEILAHFAACGLRIANLHQRSDSYRATLEAMRQGVDIIYQAHLELPPFKGYADFLVKIDGKSIFGDYCYEIWDSKLAKSVKPHFLVQLCCYAEMLAALQHRSAEHLTIILGTKEQKRFRINDYFYVYQNLKYKFLAEHQQFEPTQLPDPASSKNWGRWSAYAERLLIEVDHLIQVANITSGQIKKLNKAGINTMAALAKAQLTNVKGIKPEVLERLKAQTKIQKESRGKEIPAYLLIHRYGLYEYEVDQLLRNEVFVDLYKIVKAALLIGEPRYSIKNVEHLYRGKRDTEVGSGGDSVVVYERWRENPDGEVWQTSKILKDIRSYNIDDCNSTQELAVWLRDRQRSNGIGFLGKTELVEPEIKEDINDSIKLRDNLLARASRLNDAGEGQVAKINTVMAWSIDFHRRESKPVFWRLFDRLGLSHEELLEDIDCLAFCYRTEKKPYKPSPKARNLVYEYSFDPDQEFKGNAADYYLLGKKSAEGKNIKAAFHAEGSDLEHGIIALQIKEEPESPLTLIPNEYVDPNPIPNAIRKQAEAYLKGRLEQSAIIDFLGKSIPRIKGYTSGQAIAPSQDPKQRLHEMIQAVINLDNSYLTIQGPPGAGKTYTGKHLIAELVKRGKKVGISSNSHKAINNLLISTVQYCQEEGISGSFACTRNTEEAIDHLKVSVLETKNIAGFLQAGSVVGATAWGFAREDLENTLDYLFIDEAGQVSLANLIAISRSASNLILMGDQMQLGQPSQGSHPEDSGLSILDYLLHSTPTIPDFMGVFLGTTYRMHSAVNQFISEAVYEGKLEAAPQNDRQLIKVPPGYHGVLNKEAGIIAVPVAHEGNTQASDEEVEQIVTLTHELLGRSFTDKEGKQRSISWDDILFVAPYNYQVNKLKSALGAKARVGSVDKFQGQEAPIVFLTMCASSAHESPRGLNFLFDKNRLNVAISRAQCMAIIVYSPALLESGPRNVEQLSMMNMFCNLVQER